MAAWRGVEGGKGAWKGAQRQGKATCIHSFHFHHSVIPLAPTCLAPLCPPVPFCALATSLSSRSAKLVPVRSGGGMGRPEGLGRRRDRCEGDWDGLLQMGEVFLPGLLTCSPRPHAPAGTRLLPVGNIDQKVYQLELLESPRGFPDIAPSKGIT